MGLESALNYNKRTKKTQMQIKRDVALPEGRVWALKSQKVLSKMFLKQASE